MIWRNVTALEAIQHATGRTVEREEPGWGNESQIHFTDGSVLRYAVQAEHHYSDWTSDPAQIIIEIGEVPE